MKNHNEKKSLFIGKYRWIIGILLLITTIALQVLFWQVIPVFLDLFRDFGTEHSITIYYQIISIVMVLGELVLIPIIVCLFLVDNSKFHQFVKWFFIIYTISLPVILCITIAMIYSPIFEMGNVVG